MRNPWGVGSEEYFGDWSDKSDKWSEKFKAEVGHKDANDGIWFISAEDYHRYFAFTTLNLDMTGLHQTYYAHFDMPVGEIEELLEITSPVRQTIYVIGYYYNR